MAWPVNARAQQRERVQRVGVLMNLAAEDLVSIARAKAFAEGLRALDWIEGRNVQIDFRWADFVDQIAALLATLAAS